MTLHTVAIRFPSEVPPELAELHQEPGSPGDGGEIADKHVIVKPLREFSKLAAREKPSRLEMHMGHATRFPLCVADEDLSLSLHR
jgi:hypothetical protein